MRQIVLPAAITLALAGAAVTAGEETMRYVENGIIKVGVDLAIGGAITHVSDLEHGKNLINSHDWGRQIQMSFYSGPPNYRREGKRKSEHWGGFPWNPIQSGDSYGNGSETLEHRVEDNVLYVKSIPMLWPMDNDPGACVFETWITLDGNAFDYRGRLTNKRRDRTVYGPYHQEVPAVYTNGVWHRLMTYVGDRPFTGDALTEVRKTVQEPWPWSKWLTSESWSALVDDNNWGIGAWHPGVLEFHGGFSGPRGKGGPKDGPTGYFSPMHTDILDPDIVYDYECLFIVGSLEEIRAEVYRRHRTLPALPTWRFRRDRMHWVYRNADDSGYPFDGAWRLQLDEREAVIESPFVFWRAEDAPRLRIRAGFATQGDELRVRWLPYSDQVHTTASWQAWNRDWWKPAESVTTTVVNDGEVRELVIDLSASAGYNGGQCTLRIDLPGSAAGDSVVIERISLEPDERR